MEPALDDILTSVNNLIEERKLFALKELLTGHPAELAELIAGLEPSRRILIFRLLPKDIAVEVFEHLEVEIQSDVLSGFLSGRLIEMVDEMSPDDRARLFDELPASVIKRLRSRLTKDEWNATYRLLGYGDDTAGRIMTPEFVDIRLEQTAKDALRRVKKVGPDSETIYYLYVIDNTRRLLGVVSLKNIVLAKSDTLIRDIMNQDVIQVATDDDQEKVARIIQDYDLLAVPVVDKEGKLVGIVTVDDILDIVEEEATEDMLRMSGVEVAEKSYFKSSVLSNFKKRIGWMVLLLGLNSLTGNIIIGKKVVLEGLIILSAFIPILIGSGGNAGAQSSTVVIRGLAIGEIGIRDAFQIILREFGIGLGIGLVLGTLATLWAYWLQGDMTVSFVVGLSFIFVICVATILGTLLPVVVKGFGFDPALIATPFITSTIDVTALLIYFQIAERLLNLG
jgi:magnesium transporter